MNEGRKIKSRVAQKFKNKIEELNNFKISHLHVFPNHISRIVVKKVIIFGFLRLKNLICNFPLGQKSLMRQQISNHRHFDDWS